MSHPDKPHGFTDLERKIIQYGFFRQQKRMEEAEESFRAIQAMLRSTPTVELPRDDLTERVGNCAGPKDGTERLCQALYGRKAMPRDYIGGSDAKMLHDAADRLASATRDIPEGRRSPLAGALESGSPHDAAPDANPGGAVPGGEGSPFWQPRAEQCQSGCARHCHGYQPCRSEGCYYLRRSDRTSEGT